MKIMRLVQSNVPVHEATCRGLSHGVRQVS